ncbi:MULTISPECIES: UvrD-helicase domain-containing protein [unclassified Herbaspirillum]|uniref:UvrD-helicase domain-containing protein n=1 Tax=unclassified Herbaspirillum TaxID=2624150 RepID=UPI000E2EFB47|nr:MULTISPECIES: UvrD-helicase domain-containing protein [unclassified Herbaspirillum]RFB70837.1 hypothetical protein DZB54_09400 [Herbaspirillum sp. 3R-3a1]TFI08638.1 hypothetical protein E4P32_10855 [Herbaspirillum sp. 3R11]TFI15053.1 hypothetical protein E4P31_10850 [Herbaspirillum sp. 3R-11]TFI29758.1 hypothetical protein E4P30_05690 [Herbaspirillum sp. 3C11]
MIDDLPETLAKSVGKGYVIAPAGFGKTHLIAESVRKASKRQLVLTHTYAGVNAIRKKMQLLKIPSSLYHVDTIASWSLRQCLSYPKTSGWKKEAPSKNDWNKLYGVCSGLLDRPFMRRIILSSYGGLYVDEYQDCNKCQHALIEALSNLVPSRILGDPMQAIFDFSGQEKPIDWETEIYPHYQLLGKLSEPWRWKRAGADELAKWLKEARALLEKNAQIPLTGKLPAGVNLHSIDINDYAARGRLNCFYKHKGNMDSVIAIYSGDVKSKNKAHSLARSLSGDFSSLEEVEGKDLHSIVKKIDAANTSAATLLLSVGLLKKCCTAINEVLTASIKKGEVGKVTRSTRCPEILIAANAFLASDSYQDLAQFLHLVQNRHEVTVYRRDLLYRLMNVFRTYAEHDAPTLAEAATRYQQQFRHSGRPIRHNRLIATTLLVKGLEYDHAIVLEADTMSIKDLYVAITRGSKSVTLVTVAQSVPA